MYEVVTPHTRARDKTIGSIIVCCPHKNYQILISDSGCDSELPLLSSLVPRPHPQGGKGSGIHRVVS